MNGKITTAATILLLLAATGVEAQNTFLCKIPANYVAAPTTKGPIGQNPARTCDDWVSEHINGVLSGEDFSATYDCAGKSALVLEAISSIVGAGCCGGNSGLARSACFKDRSHICKTSANYLPSAQVTVGDGGNTMTCDALVENTPNGALTGQDFSSTYDCAGKSEDVLQGIGLVVGAGCCAGNSGLAKSACWLDRSHICKTSTNYEPFKQVSGPVTGGNAVPCDTVVNLIDSGALAAQDYTSAYSCSGKSAAILSDMASVAGLGCCGANGKDACAPTSTCAQVTDGSAGGAFVCGAGFSLKASPEGITCGAMPCLDNTDATQKAACCDADAATPSPAAATPAPAPAAANPAPAPAKKTTEPEPPAPAPAGDMDASSTLSTGALALVVSLFAMAVLY